jgi:hypothetical protein
METGSIMVSTARMMQNQCDKEPLHKLMEQEHTTWKSTIKASTNYRPREAAQHSQRLTAYVEAAAARAAGQLEPGLKKEVYEAMGLPA